MVVVIYCFLVQEQISEMEKQLALLRQKETVLLSALSEEDSKVKSIEDEMSVEKQQIDVEWEKIHKRESELQVDIVRHQICIMNYTMQPTHWVMVGDIIPHQLCYF